MSDTNQFRSSTSTRRSHVASVLWTLAILVVMSAQALTQTYQVIHRFKGVDGSGPNLLMRDNKGILYGTTTGGGTYSLGTVFRMDQKGLTTLYSFSAGDDGCMPEGGLIRDAAGN